METVIKTLAMFAAAFCAAFGAFGAPSYTIDIKFRDGKQVVAPLPAIRTPDGARRLVLPREFANRASVIERVLITSDSWNANKGDPGWYLLPLGQLVEFNQDSGSVKSDLPMTMFGIKTPAVCELAILKGSPYAASLVAKAENGKYTFAIQVLSHHFLRPPRNNLIVDLYTMPAGGDNYSAMARRYRQYQLSERGCVPLKERVKNNPVLKKSVDNILMRVKFGAKPHTKYEQTEANEPKPYIMNTFDDMTGYILWLKKNGVDCVDFHCVGWNKSGHDGRWPQLLPVEPLFGGEAALRRTIKTAVENGYQISAHTNYTGAVRIANNWDDNLMALNWQGKLASRGSWSGGLTYQVCPKQVIKLRLKEDMDIVKNLGFNGMHHIDVLTCTVPFNVCYSKAHYCDADDMADAYAYIMKYCRKKFGGFTSECSSDYAAANFDYCLYVWAWPCHYPKKNDFVSKLVPIWQIAYHGIIMSQPYWDTVDPTYQFSRGIYGRKGKKTWERVLNVVEFGGRPSFYFVGNYKKAGLEGVKKMYDLYQPLKYLQYEFMDEHKELAPGVFLTRYSDGSETVCNYADTPYTYKGKEVASHSFLLFK